MVWRRGRPYSQDLRERVFAAADDGAQVCEAAEMLHVSVSYVSKVLERRRTTGETSARPQGGGMRPKLAGLYDAIRGHVASRPDATIAELRTWLREAYTISASVGLVWRTLALLGLTLKKSRSERPNRTARMWPRHVPNGARPSRS
jgi:transposase